MGGSMTYPEALEIGAKTLMAFGASHDEAVRTLDGYIQYLIDMQSFLAEKGKPHYLAPNLQYLCDLKEGKTTEDMPVSFEREFGNVERFNKIGIPRKTKGVIHA
jgi:hypothetical protein